MGDGRKRSAAKQARRDARRRKAQRGRVAGQDAPEEAPLIDEVREALDGGQPMDLLGLVGMVILATAPKPALLQGPDEEDLLSLDELVAAFIDVRVPETTAILAVLGEVIVDDDGLRERCRQEVMARDDDLPRWLAELARANVHAAARMVHVLGDGEEILLGVRLADGQELTCAIFVDHLEMSEIKDAFFVSENIDAVIGVAKASNDDADTTFVDLDLADANARVRYALDQHLTMPLSEESDTWPSSRPLVQWLLRMMPTGAGSSYVPQRLSGDDARMRDRFFASLVGMPFDQPALRQLLEICIEEGTGDPLRWSAPRLTQLLDTVIVDDGDIPVEAQLAVPELLRAFVPFAHAESGIREELTAEALAAIDDASEHYRAEVTEPW